MKLRALVSAVAVALAVAPAASAATVSVPAGTADSNATCSASPCPNLRSAIGYANANPGTTVSLGAGTYSLSFGELDLTQSATITGQGMSATKIEQTDGANRVLEIEAGTTVTLQGLELTGGVANVPLTVATNTYDYGGGGILDQASQLTLDHVLLHNNKVVGANEPDGATGPDGHGGQSAAGGGIDIPYTPPPLAGTRALTITNSTISGNTAQGGDGGAMTVSTINNAGSGGAAVGGGIYAGQKTTIDVTDTTLSGNDVIGGAGGGDAISGQGAQPGNAGDGGPASGGAINTSYGSTSLVRVTLSSNAATGGTPGGDIYASAYVGTGGNGFGGAFGSGAAGTIATHSLYIENSTFAGNTANGGSAGFGTVNGGAIGAGYGGALQLYPGNVTIYSSTLDGNSATGGTGDGTGTGGGNVDIFGTKLNLQGTIIAGGSASAGTENCRVEASNPAATFIDDGNNLESSTPSQCGLSAANNDLLGSDPLLQPLADNGGPTETVALGAGSPALNAGGDCYVNVDERGFPRPSGACDVGAFQHQSSVTKTGDATISGTPAVGHTLTCSGATFVGDSLTISYSWLRNGTAISGATSSTYTLANADGGTQVSCRVTATGPAGTAASTSAAVTVSTPGGPGGGGAKPGSPSLPSQQLIAAASGTVTVKLSCSNGSSPCAGTVELTVTQVGKAFLARAAKPKVIVIASTSFTITAGHTGTAKLKLTKLGRRLLRTHPHGVAVTLRVVRHGRTVTSKHTKLRAHH